MILLDDDPQPWEKNRNEIIRSLATGIRCMYGNLPVDTVMYGVDEGRTPIIIGCEVKRPDDMVNSITMSGRLVQQFRAAAEFGCTRLYLFLQGITRPGRSDGLLEHYHTVRGGHKPEWTVTNPAIEYSRWVGFQNTLLSRGIMVKRTSDPYETAAEIVNLYHWWQKPPEEHDSLDRFKQTVLLAKDVPFFRKLIKEFDGVGWQRSMDFFLEFAGQGLSPQDVLNLEPKQWARVKGIGKGTVEKMVEQWKSPIAKP